MAAPAPAVEVAAAAIGEPPIAPGRVEVAHTPTAAELVRFELHRRAVRVRPEPLTAAFSTGCPKSSTWDNPTAALRG